MDTPVVHAAAGTASLDWRGIIGGAIAAAALSVLLLGFGAAIGLSLTSARPYAGVPTVTLAILTTLWFAVVHVGSFSVGGYVAARFGRNDEGDGDARRFRDGMHGFLVWALGTLIGAYMIASTASSVTGAVADRTVQTAGQIAGAAGNGGSGQRNSQQDGQARGGSVLQESLGYTVDRLLRREPNASASTGGNVPQDSGEQQEIARILAVAVAQGHLDPLDREYVANLLARRNGLSVPDAQVRVDNAYQMLRQRRDQAERAVREAADAARRGAVIFGFLTAAISLAGLVAAAWAAAEGGRHRDEARGVSLFGSRRFW